MRRSGGSARLRPPRTSRLERQRTELQAIGMAGTGGDAARDREFTAKGDLRVNRARHAGLGAALGVVAPLFCILHSPFCLRLGVACTWLVPCIYHACTSQSPPKHLACTWLVPGFGRPHPAFLLSAFCFGSAVALGRFARLFCIHHSSFCLRPNVALAGLSRHSAFRIPHSLLPADFRLLDFGLPADGASAPPESPRSLPVVGLIGDKRYYGEAPVRPARGSGGRAHLGTTTKAGSHANRNAGFIQQTGEWHRD